MAGFQKGDVVCLKSGGPTMTIEALGNFSGGLPGGISDGAKCIWFDEKNERKQAVFDVATLMKDS